MRRSRHARKPTTHSAPTSSGLKQNASPVIIAARKNPIAAALIGGGALWLLIGNEKLKSAASLATTLPIIRYASAPSAIG